MKNDTSAEIDAPLPLEEPNDNGKQNSEERPNKRRRKKSIVWDHFTIESAGPSCMKACCKHCKKLFAYINGSKLAGTSHLKRHITLGICSGVLPVSEAKTPNTPGTKSDVPKRRYRTNAASADIPFDQERCTRELAKMIIRHDYPLHIVEHPAFVDFVRTLHPRYNMVSFNTIQGECVSLYLQEKQRLLEHISEIPGRVNLTLDLATSNLSIGYAFLTGHFINSDWNLERQILNVIMLPFPDSDDAFYQAALSCMSDWHLENKVLTITLDKSYSNETIMGNLRGLLPVKNSLLLNGQLLKGNCFARLLSQLAQDAMTRVQETIRRIRESVKYVKTSETHEEMFSRLRQQLQVPSTMELVVDDLTKWNTTYKMLAAACELKEVFGCLDTVDPIYKINPSVDDWKQVEVLCTVLKLFFEAASILTAPTYSANAFYHEVTKIQLYLSISAISHDPFVSNLTRSLNEKFDAYWRENFLVLAIAVIMDPRFKMKLVEFSLSKIFGEDAGGWIKSVNDGIHELFLEYIAPPPAYLMIHSNIHQSDPSEVVVLPQINGCSHGFSSVEDQSMHVNSHLNHSDAPREVAFVPEIEGPSEEFFFLNGQSQSVPYKKLQPEEKKPQELHPQGFLPQEVQHTTKYPKETFPPTEMMGTEEVPTEDVDMQEVLAASSPEKAPAPDQVAEEAQAPDLVPIEAAAQELAPQESSAEEMLLEGVPSQGMISRGVQTQDMFTQVTQLQEDPNMAHDMQHQQVNPQEVHSRRNGFSDFDVYISAMASNKSELDEYLEESLLPREQDFDVLGWWKANKLKYPTLSRLAADVLSMPVSTVGPESVFDTSSKKIDTYHGSLHPLTLEAIVCVKEWLHGNGSFQMQ